MLFLIALLFIPFIFFYLLHKQRTTASLNIPPGPPGLPLIGNLHQLPSSDLHLHLWRLSNHYGPLMHLRLASIPTLVVSSAKMAELFLKTHDLQMASRPSLLGQRKYSYDCSDLVFSPYGDYWRELRKLCVVHLFNTKRVQSFRSLREDEVLRMMNNISKSASLNQVTNLSEAVMRLTSSIICRAAFGKRYEDEGNKRSQFHGMLNEEQAMIAAFYFTDHLPFIGHWIDRLRGLLSRLEKNFTELDNFFQQIIDDHIHSKARKSDQEEDFIDVCLGLTKDTSSFELSLTSIKALLTDIFIAGTDTGAATLVWAMTALIKNPRVMNKVKEEIRNLKPRKSFIDEDDLQRLPYLEAAVKETLRMYPPAPLMVPREATEKCQIGGYDIEDKSVIYFNVWAIGRDPEAWEQPEEFNPERFEGRSVDFSKGQGFGWIPFGGGRRICPGIQLGVVTVELALANLLNSFDWELPKGMKVEDIDTDVLPGIAMHKKNALCLMPKKLQDCIV
ncbi:cytochrome P450 71A1-like [Neltuma alba]|uniref:cytochrome P450 71A1-like n=1 Tax=Neltuma alba TaxID=207710 RepID=UPI0010A371AC|nr:cytochrome P450 71A1-like [Prosopis alba]XP_028803042.1 cytochrome P450 71A1-like [Prosopis alba]XP_028803065.1 cytochrome P450 71A1-like [Prosopis alba]